MVIYCIDTSALIHAWRDLYPPDVFGTFWDQLSDLSHRRRLIAPYDVFLELERRDDAICAWAKAHEHMFVELDEDGQSVVQQIVDKYSHIVPKESPDGIWADPYVIALAYTSGATVVTGEKLKPPGSKWIRIPNICNDMSVPWKTVLELIRQEEWKY